MRAGQKRAPCRRRSLAGICDRDRDVGLQVGTAPAVGPHAVEEVRQDVAEVAHLKGLAALLEGARVEALKAALARPAGARVEGAEAQQLVVLLALVGVGEGLVELPLASMNFSSAARSPGFLSGWYLRASLRKALRISSCEAPRATPRV